MKFNNREDIIALTPKWTGERLPDGRPKVPDKYLDALYGMTLEELWKPIFVQGYEHQFIAMKSLHPEQTSVSKKCSSMGFSVVQRRQRKTETADATVKNVLERPSVKEHRRCFCQSLTES